MRQFLVVTSHRFANNIQLFTWAHVCVHLSLCAVVFCIGCALDIILSEQSLVVQAETVGRPCEVAVFVRTPRTEK